ncbi:helix-turn-helix transcriptional regulator [Nocardioides sp. WS12]|uniref:helix-turn-helix domain-containing protein n=1 Tax=Nocardioides sp. WS12 TaxID=2486272 RepID=UPI0015F817F9|nr:helix-turn-helix transcriptional regulator [Nocardioides sp. WS12]
MGQVIAFQPNSPEPNTPEPLWREQVGQQLREQRVAAGWRLRDVAERAGVSIQYLSELERGLKDPSSELLAAIAGALGSTVREVASRAIRSTPTGPVCLAA